MEDEPSSVGTKKMLRNFLSDQASSNVNLVIYEKTAAENPSLGTNNSHETWDTSARIHRRLFSPMFQGRFFHILR